MKTSFLLLSLFLFHALSFAQSPLTFNYQAVARDAEGLCLSTQSIDVRIGIRDSSATGTLVYLEQHDQVLTNEQGLFSLSIGMGIPQGTPGFNALDWSIGQRWLEIEIDTGSGFILIGSQQLMSVPYALHSNKAQNAAFAKRSDSTQHAFTATNADSSQHAIFAESADSAQQAVYADTAQFAFNIPFFDSGWFPMSSQAGANSYQEIVHGLGSYPTEVKVLVRAVDGNNLGFIFEGMGAAQSDDDAITLDHGGLIFGYNQQMVRLWAPTQNNGTSNGRIININDGWGNEINDQFSNNAEVRVLVWR